MKKIILFTLFIFGSIAVFSQTNAQQNNPKYDDGLLHWGFHFGFNTSVLQPTFSAGFAKNDTLLSIEPDHRPGFQFGVVSEVRLNDAFTARFVPSLNFINRGMFYNFANPAMNANKQLETIDLSFPVSLKYRGNRVGNYRLYTIAGGSFNIDMSSEERVRDEIDRLKITRQNIGIEYGLGFDFYFPYFKLSPEIKVQQLMGDILVPENNVYSSSLSKLGARTIFLTFIFQ